MEDIGQQPSERDEAIYAAWESGKSLRILARNFETSVTEIEHAIDRCLPPFTTQNQMRAYKRDLQRLDDVSAFYYAKAMAGDCDSAHIFCRVQERRSAVSGWSSVNVRLDPYAAQVQEEPSSYDKIRAAIWRIARPGQPMPDSWKDDVAAAALVPPVAPSEKE